MATTRRKIIVAILSVLIILAFWQLVSLTVKIARGVDFPDPLSTFSQLSRNIKGDTIYEYSIWEHTFTSLARWLSGYLIAAVLGIATGFLLGTNQTIYKLLMPFITVLQLVPGLAWIPVALLLFGLGVVSTVFMIFVIAFAPIAIITATGVRNTPSELIHAAQIMGAGKKQIFFHVLLPSSLFHIIDGMRIGLANSWRVLIAAEMIVGNGIGLGYIIIQSRWTMNYISAFVSILIIVIFGLTVEKLVFQNIENRLRLKYGDELSSETIKFE